MFRSYKLDVSEKFPDCSLRHGQGTQGVSSPFREVTIAGISHFIPDKSFSSSSFYSQGCSEGMDQVKPVPGRKGRKASCWKLTVVAAVVGSVMALYMGILLGECTAEAVLLVYHLLQKSNGLHSNSSHTKNSQKPFSEAKTWSALPTYTAKMQRL